MEIKKSPKADLEGKKTTGLLIGLVLILAAMFVAFEWTKRDVVITADSGIVDVPFEEEMVILRNRKNRNKLLLLPKHRK